MDIRITNNNIGLPSFLEKIIYKTLDVKEKKIYSHC